MSIRTRALVASALIVLSGIASAATASAHVASRAVIQRTVDRVVHPLMAKHGIPGMAVGVIVDGKPYVFDYGVASLETRRPVTHGTLFEVGSISKTFTATLASWAQTKGRLSFSDPVARFLPSLRGTAFGRVPLLDLATHTPGGLPLQVPDSIHDRAQLMAYFRAWRPTWPPGTHRTYSNIGIGTLGLIAARAMGGDFDMLMQRRLFPALGLRDTFLHVPASRSVDYAQGYTGQGTPIRMAPGVLDAEAYGVRTTAADLLRFVQANLGMIALDPVLQRAIADTHTGYYVAGPMTQDLIWEQYPWPVTPKRLQQGNAPAMLFDPSPVTALRPPRKPRPDRWINKTGSTNGFAAYVAFVPQQRMGIVLLANRSLSNAARIDAAYAILTALPGPHASP
jgi:beta-lactamase class C